jgi:AraC family L-rhamnose operon regulatory protein RhaS
LEIARSLLEQGRLNCTEAALESGFNDSNYFSRAFRKAYGHPPSVLVRPN